jgi:hypothetical protein
MSASKELLNAQIDELTDLLSSTTEEKKLNELTEKRRGLLRKLQEMNESEGNVLTDSPPNRKTLKG